MSILFRAECVAAITADLPLDRYDPTRGLNGTLLFHRSFHVSVPALLITSGHFHIVHSQIPVTGFTDYAIYANGRVGLTCSDSEYALPAATTPTPVISLDGMNISNFADHYASPNLAAQKVLAPGYYRVSAWAGVGSDASDVDGLGKLAAYNCANTQQFNILVVRL